MLDPARVFPLTGPVSERLKDLQRQRALAQEQLDWLDREIARETGAAAPPAPSPAPAAAAPTTAGPAHSEAEVEAMMAQYRSDPEALQTNVKRGCFLYFFVALGLLLLALLAFYFLRKPR
jgi:hypothetical protein